MMNSIRTWAMLPLPVTLLILSIPGNIQAQTTANVSSEKAENKTVEPGTAEEEATEAESAEEETAGSLISLTMAIDTETAYVFRGLNIFQGAGQHDPNAILAPELTWSFGDSGLWLDYWGAYQISGDNISQLVDEGLGMEQDFTLGYDRDLNENGLALSARLICYLYPFADPDVAGVTMPSYLEPGITLSLSRSADFGFGISYMTNTQSELAGTAYLYLNPTIQNNSAPGNACTRGRRQRRLQTISQR